MTDFENDIEYKPYKIFVGNVPYESTQQEFTNFFKNMNGVINAQLIYSQKTNISRGFGFITFDTYNNAELIKNNKNIIFKGRKLRFTNYKNYKNYKNNDKNITLNVKNYIYVDNIPNGKDRKWLREFFFEYEPIGKCFIATNYKTGQIKSNGLIEVIENNKYEEILKKKYHICDDIVLTTTKYKLFHNTYGIKKTDNRNIENNNLVINRNIL